MHLYMEVIILTLHKNSLIFKIKFGKYAPRANMSGYRGLGAPVSRRE